MTNSICFAEWDLDFTHMNQRVHFCAASILAMYSHYVKNDGNIQNVLHKAQIKQMLKDAGFTTEKVCTVDATYLKDGKWEKDYANRLRTRFGDVPPMIQTLVTSYYELMNATNKDENSLNSFVVLAT